MCPLHTRQSHSGTLEERGLQKRGDVKLPVRVSVLKATTCNKSPISRHFLKQSKVASKEEVMSETVRVKSMSPSLRSFPPKAFWPSGNRGPLHLGKQILPYLLTLTPLGLAAKLELFSCFSGIKITGVSKTSLLIFIDFARFLALTAKFWQVNDHRKRQELTMNQPKTTLFRSRTLKGRVFLSPELFCFQLMCS